MLPPTRAAACTLAAAALATAATGAVAQTAPECPNADVMPIPEVVPQVETATLCLMNAERARRDVPPLAASGRLRLAAARHSRDMATQDYFSHVSDDGRRLATRVRPTGYLRGWEDWLLGENLGYGTGTLSTPRAVVRSWMESPGHRANLLDRDFVEAGIGMFPGVPVEGRSGGGTYTSNLGVRLTRVR